MFYLLLDIIEDSREAPVDIFHNSIKVIENHPLPIENLTSIGADNANVNFGQNNSVSKLFKDIVPYIHKSRLKYYFILYLRYSNFNLCKNLLTFSKLLCTCVAQWR